NGVYDNQVIGTPVFGDYKLYLGSSLSANDTPGLFFDGKIDEVVYWDKALSDTEIANLYHRGGNRVQIQVRSCSDVSCSADPDFVGISGDSSQYFSELLNNSLGLPSIDINGSVPTNRYFQYRMYMESDNSSSSPKINNIRIFSE
ncbi:MAG: hypothetical protein KDD58_08045, partial [Bdellovibrionales bacterium]|nr:hypothetical protein [Bdellovibrionales bacterium]